MFRIALRISATTDEILFSSARPMLCRDGYTKFEKQVFSQSYNKADKHEGTYTDAMSRENLYILLKAREAKLIVDCNKKA